MFHNRIFKILNTITLVALTFSVLEMAPVHALGNQPQPMHPRSQPGTPIGYYATAISAGYDHACALTSGGGVKCWGNNNYGKLGNGTTIGELTPVDVSDLTSGVSAISAGKDHTCALTTGGGVKCWGKNDNGQLGDGTIIYRSTPVDVTGLTSGVSAISAKGIRTCALTISGGIKCWGSNSSGQLGDGTITEKHIPVDVLGLTSGASAVSAGYWHTCAVTTSGGVKCWGANPEGWLGDGTTTSSSIPVDVSGLTSGVSALSLGERHTCALTTSGGVKCWGNNLYGRLGDGTIIDRLTPVDVSGFASGVSAIEAGDFHNCVLTINNGIKCWGWNNAGQIGDNTTINRFTPVDVGGLTSGVNAVSGGYWYTCAITAGRIKCWGNNSNGQLGDGTTASHKTPMDVIGSGTTSPFLDLPFQYTSFSTAAKGSNSGGYVNSWFDHTNPGYGNDDGNLTTWLGPYTGSVNVGRTNCNTPPGGFGISCYDSHDGIDFKHVTDEVLAAAPGKVFGIGYQPSGFGNFLYINHQNCYASFYAHLKNATTLQNGDTVVDRQPIGIMGNTGLSIGGGGGIHLHFGLYYDPTCDGNFSDKVVVDPYGWSGAGTDPWITGASKYLWKYNYDFAQQSITSTGGSASTPSGNLSITVPTGAVASPVTLELWSTPPVADASASLRSTGNSFWMRVLEWLNASNNAPLMAAASTNRSEIPYAISGLYELSIENIFQMSLLKWLTEDRIHPLAPRYSTNTFDAPVGVTVYYDPSITPHLDTDQSVIYQWDDVGQVWLALTTTLDTVNHQAFAQTTQPGHFDLQAPLVCPADTLEPNDNYDGSSIAKIDGTSLNNLFDIAQDKDWFKFEVIAGTQYDIQTTNLTAGLDTVLEIYDTDGVTLLASDDNSGGGNASSLTWEAPQDGLYFARVVQVSGSSFGCDLNYDFTIAARHTLTIVSDYGTVTKDPNKTIYHEGDIVQLTAQPAIGWSFTNWIGDLTGSINPDSVTIHGNTSVTANYIQNEYTLTVTSVNGTIIKNPNQTTYHEGDVVQLTAKPSSGWLFSNWTGGLTSNTNPDFVTIHGNTMVAANYTKVFASFYSTGLNDGWTLESSEFSNLASTKNSSGTLRVGDDARNKQYRSLLYFDTASLPNNAVVTKVTVQIKQASMAGAPITTLGSLVADMKKGYFGLSPLELSDFQAAAAPINTAGKFTLIPPVAPSTEEWYQLTLSPSNFKYINLAGVTQFRLRFTKDDDNDKKADFTSFYSGDATLEDDQPRLVIEYWIP